MLVMLGIVIPTILLFVGMLGKKVVSGGLLEWKDWYLGLEFTLATFVASALNLGDLYRLETRADNAIEKAEAELARVRDKAVGNPDLLAKLATHEENSRLQRELLKENKIERGWSLVCLVFSITSFFIAAMLHREWEPRPDSLLGADEIKSKRTQLIGMTLLGYACMLIFMLVVKGIY